MNKSTGLAVFVCIVLAGMVWVKQGEKQERGVSRVSFTQLDSTQISGLTIKGKHPVVLKRQEDSWTVESGRRADATAVKAALDALVKIDSTNLVTQKPERFAELKVDEKEGTHVVVSSGDSVVADFVIGSADAGGSYILFENKVYSMKRVFPGTFSRPTASWVDRRVVQAEMDAIARVEIKVRESESYSLVPSADDTRAWSLANASVLPDGFRFDHAAAYRLVNALSDLRAREFVDGASHETMGLGEEASRVVVHFKDTGRAAQTLVIGQEAGSKLVYGKVLPQGDVFIFSSHSSQLLTQAPRDFRDLRLIDFSLPDVQSFEIMDGSMKAELKRQGEGWVVGSANPPLPQGFELDVLAVEARLQVLKNYRAKALAPDTKPRKTKFKRSKKQVRVTLGDGSTRKIEFGAVADVKGETMLYARGAIDTALYYADQGSLGAVLSDLKSMGKKVAPQRPNLGNLDPSSLSQLPPEIRKQILMQLEQEEQKKKMLKAFQQQRTVNPALKGEQVR
ncbi:MAG: DUF4340 domain-containing protein [Deltaproteobacteria bacterium]|nr:DUF4340 domain-containing protein [Deltaproteobacteria bacterium]